ncbi:unnamed protein product [Urochloa humidicola]
MRSPGSVRRMAAGATGGDAAHPIARGPRAAYCAACGEPRTEAVAIATGGDLRGDGGRSCGDGGELLFFSPVTGGGFLFLFLMAGGVRFLIAGGARSSSPWMAAVIFPMNGGELLFLSPWLVA